MKTATACIQCRASKRKCWRGRTRDSCMQCLRNHLPCTFGPSVTLPAATTSGSSKENDTTGAAFRSLVSSEVAETLVEDYIRLIHDRPHSLFHIPSLRSAVRLKQLNSGTYCALLSYGARFHPTSAVCTLATCLFEEAKRYLHSDLENVCLDNIQTSILVANLSAASLKPSSEALYLGIAIRMAEILRLNVPQQNEPPMMQELKRRVWCTLFMADRWCSAGSSLPRKMNDFDGTVGLPIDEAVFHQPADVAVVEHERPAPGLWAHMITLAEIFGPIQDLNRRIAQQGLSERVIEDTVSRLKLALETWEFNLPDHVKYNLTNLRHHRAKGLGGPFVALHQGFNHYATLLFYQYLDTNRATSPTTMALAQRCKQYAKDQSALFRTAKDLGKCDVLYPGVGHSAAISSSVLLHTLLFGKEEELDETRTSLQSNFELLKDLSRYWPSLELIVRRLTVFQKACLQHAASQPYKFDNWMVRFLHEYHLPLDDKAFDETRDLDFNVSEPEQTPLHSRGAFGTTVLQYFWERDLANDI